MLFHLILSYVVHKDGKTMPIAISNMAAARYQQMIVIYKTYRWKHLSTVSAISPLING
jgi:hypothetical protein